jgi:hypothetical protein
MIKTPELTGALLDYWVARAEGLIARDFIDGNRVWYTPDGEAVINSKDWSPSNNWAHGGPLVGKYKMYVEWDADGYWVAATNTGKQVQAPAPLQAICRAVVRAKFGDEVEDVL